MSYILYVILNGNYISLYFTYGILYREIISIFKIIFLFLSFSLLDYVEYIQDSLQNNLQVMAYTGRIIIDQEDLEILDSLLNTVTKTTR